MADTFENKNLLEVRGSHINISKRKYFGRMVFMLSLLFAVIATAPVNAHNIPSEVTVHVFVKPEGNILRVLLRVPVEAMSEIVFPLRGPGYLELKNIEPVLRDAAHIYITQELQLYEQGKLLESKQIVNARVSLPLDRSFTDFSSAYMLINGPTLTSDTTLYWAQAMMDVQYNFQIESEASDFSINPTLGRLGIKTNTVLHYVLPNGKERLYSYMGDPGLVRLDPSALQAVYRFIQLGFFHILDGIDHILFLLCLVAPLRKFRTLVPVVTSFTIAHSITLIATAFKLAPDSLWFPPLIETLIALSIIYMAFDNIIGARLKHRWLVAFAFGLVHGFGFSFILSETMQFAGSHLFTSLLAFNLGVEFGQLFLLILIIPLLTALFKYIVAEKMGTILLSALVAHSAWHWMTERGSSLAAYEIELPVLDITFAVSLMRWSMLLIIIGSAAWLMYGLYTRFNADTEGVE